MKLITAALVSAVSCYTELAAAATGHVLTLNPSRDQPSSSDRALSPETARLVIAQRAGVEDYHVEKALSEEEINAVNDYGVQTPMLSAQKEDEKRTFILAFVDETVAESMLARLERLFQIYIDNTLQVWLRKRPHSPSLRLPQHPKPRPFSTTYLSRAETASTAGARLNSNSLLANISIPSPATTRSSSASPLRKLRCLSRALRPLP